MENILILVTVFWIFATIVFKKLWPFNFRMKYEEPSLGSYVKIGLIGSGGYGDILRYDLKKAFNGYSNHPKTMAVKRVIGSTKLREIDMCRLIHKNIVTFYGVETIDYIIHIKMELAKSNLKEFRAKTISRQFDENEFFYLALQISEGVEYLHANGVAHRDIKPHNILVFYQDKDRGSLYSTVLKLCDFGLSRNLPLASSTFSWTPVGTPAYLAPEVEVAFKSNIKFKGDYKMADIYSCGIVFLELLIDGLPPKPENSISSLHPLDNKELIQYIRDDIVELLAKMLSMENKERISVTQVVATLRPWFNDTMLTHQLVHKSFEHNVQTVSQWNSKITEDQEEIESTKGTSGIEQKQLMSEMTGKVHNRSRHKKIFQNLSNETHQEVTAKKTQNAPTDHDGQVIEDNCEKDIKSQLTFLLLGETGVGKTTFINAFANYLTYDTLQEAIDAEEMVSPVKSKFHVTNSDYNLIEVTTGTEDNEMHVAGGSSTQSTRAHVFNFEGRYIRLIDTPGIGDTRGIQQDKENLQNILSYISFYQEIHGICILLKPNNARLTIIFEFCIKELLIHLHKAAARNIVFCFTNARGTLYKPGDSLIVLKTLITAQRECPIKLNKDMLFCMDNESFRFLAALKNGVEFDKNECEMYKESWKRAKEETVRMLNYVSQIQPHQVKDTICVSDVRRKILVLTKPLAEIAKQIETAIAIVKVKKKEIEANEKSAEEIKAAISVQISTLEPRHLSHPRTVCTSPSCSEDHVVNGQLLTKYLIICHEPCNCTEGITADSINTPELKQCWALEPSNGESCRTCGCRWNVHMKVTYDLVSVTKTMEDANVKGRYKDVTSYIQMRQIAITELETTIRELEYERRMIMQATAQFGLFLKKISLLPYNDAMLGYLDYMIKQEKANASISRDYSQVDAIAELKERYEHEVNALKVSVENQGESVSSNSSHDIILQLSGMRHFGATIQSVMKDRTSKVHHETEYRIGVSQARHPEPNNA